MNRGRARSAVRPQKIRRRGPGSGSTFSVSRPSGGSTRPIAKDLEIYAHALSPIAFAIARQCRRHLVRRRPPKSTTRGTNPHKSNDDIDWRDQVIYQIMVDRFSNGDPNNDYQRRDHSVAGRYHGGDWQGIDRPASTTWKNSASPPLWISPTSSKTPRKTRGSPRTTGTGRLISCSPNPSLWRPALQTARSWSMQSP